MGLDESQRDVTEPPVLEYHIPPGAGLDRQPPPFGRRECMLGILILICIVLFAGYLSRPPLSRASEKANRTKCASNMREIGQAILIYANDHGGAFPPDFPQLLIHGQLNSEIFTCPSSNQEKGQGFTIEEVAASLTNPIHCSYIYLGAGLTRLVRADTIIAVERAENHEAEGINILQADGHVKWVKKGPEMDRIRKAVAASQPVRAGGR